MNVPPEAFIISLDDMAEMGDHASNGLSPSAEQLGRALAATPGWSSPEQVVIVVRHAPVPQLGILGFLSDTDRNRIETLPGSVRLSLSRLRYVDYRDIEKDCERLAEQLLEELGATKVREAHFVAIPRGGLLVLGALSYFLDLSPEQVHRTPDRPELLIVVDDCSLSGARFRETLQEYRGAQEVVFAPLYSHPDLRRAIVETEPRVTACVGARDLHDHAPEHYGDDYEAWSQQWAERSGNTTYWSGLPDHVTFPWNEPDINVWDEASQRSRHGWRVVPPELCIKSRIALREGPAVFVQPEGADPLRPASDIIFGPVADRILIARTGDQQCFDLQGSGAEMWTAIVNHGSIDDAVAVLRNRYDIDEERLRKDAAHLVDQLLSSGLLEDTRHP